jgi:hypothetical protein
VRQRQALRRLLLLALRRELRLVLRQVRLFLRHLSPVL